MLTLSGITKTYGERRALDDVSFDVAPGRLTGFVGGNGAGKTTTMRIVLGLLAHEAGTVALDGVGIERITDLTRDAATVKKRLAWIARQQKFSVSPYEALAAICQEQQNPAGARTVMLVMHHHQIDAMPTGARRRTARVWWALTGYGYRMWIVAVAALLVVGVSIGAAFAALVLGAVIPTEVDADAIASVCTAAYPCFDPMTYGIDAVVPVVDFHHSALWAPDSSTAVGRWYGASLIVLKLLGWAGLTITGVSVAQRLRS